MSKTQIAVGVSACVVGENVRYNGGHKLSRFVRDDLGEYVSFVPVCPEVEVGMGVPRETIRLVRPGRGTAVEVVAARSGTNWTRQLDAWADARAAELEHQELCGFVFQKGSPSCGMERVRVYPSVDGGMPQRDGVGIFARALMRRLPLLPVEEDGRLNDPLLRENFVTRVFAYHRLRCVFSAGWTLGDLVAFHSREKLLLLAHDERRYRELGRLVARAKQLDRAALQAAYSRLFMLALGRNATRRRHTNVLQHMVGYFRQVLDDDSRGELRDLVEAYRLGELPLIVLTTMIAHHARRHQVSYLVSQSYIAPHPQPLRLRNQI